MIIIRFQGGLGNQLFQYALYEELRQAGKVVKADLSTFGKKMEPRRFALEEAFGIKLDIADEKEIFKLSGGDKNIYEKLVRKFVKGRRVYKEKEGITLEQMMQLEDGYLNGFWQSAKWFPNAGDSLRQNLHIENINEEVDRLCRQLRKEESVSVHIRMGDYLDHSDLYGGICTCDYYVRAIQYIKEKRKAPKFYVISDEIDKAKDLLKEEQDIVYLESSVVDYYDLKIISSCKDNILANSSFSWWGTWLNTNSNKIVIAPPRWDNITNPQDIYMEEWIRM